MIRSTLLAASALATSATDPQCLPWDYAVTGGLPPPAGANQPQCVLEPETLEYNCDYGENKVFDVEAGKTYRLRLVQGSASWALGVSVKNHNLVVIAKDGTPVRPRVAGSILMDIGERYDVLLSFCEPEQDATMTFFPYNTDKTGNSFEATFRVSGVGRCPGEVVRHDGRISYATGIAGAAWIAASGRVRGYTGQLYSLPYDPMKPTTAQPVQPPGTVPLCATEYGSSSTTTMTTAKGGIPATTRGTEPITLEFGGIMSGGKQGTWNKGKGGYEWTINGDMFAYPSPALTYLTGDLAANGAALSTMRNAGHGHAPIHVGLGEVRDVWVPNLSGMAHPVHLHGNQFWVVGASAPGACGGMGSKACMQTYAGALAASAAEAGAACDPPLMDSVSVPPMGWLLLRVRFDNPGAWFIHCHIDPHLARGMAAVIVVGGAEQQPRLPADFPPANGVLAAPPLRESEGGSDGEGEAATSAQACSATGRTVRYNLTVSEAKVAADGYERLIQAYNGAAVGPTIEADLGDCVEVAVTNAQMSQQGTTVHWHGMLQRGTPFYDGVDGISQDAIPPGATFTYRFRAEPAGTHWYHSHTGAQYANALRGGLVVRDPAAGGPSSSPEADPWAATPAAGGAGSGGAGGGGAVPFPELFALVSDWSWRGADEEILGLVDGSYPGVKRGRKLGSRQGQKRRLRGSTGAGMGVGMGIVRPFTQQTDWSDIEWYSGLVNGQSDGGWGQASSTQQSCLQAGVESVPAQVRIRQLTARRNALSYSPMRFL